MMYGLKHIPVLPKTCVSSIWDLMYTFSKFLLNLNIAMKIWILIFSSGKLETFPLKSINIHMNKVMTVSTHLFQFNVLIE